MALDVLFCKDLVVNVENSPVRTFSSHYASLNDRFNLYVLEMTVTHINTILASYGKL